MLIYGVALLLPMTLLTVVIAEWRACLNLALTRRGLQ
jgi:hypothetical protein